MAPSLTCSLNVPSEPLTFSVVTLVTRPLASTVITGTSAAEPYVPLGAGDKLSNDISKFLFVPSQPTVISVSVLFANKY